MRTGIAMALSALAAAVVVVAACSSTPVLTTGSTFSAPYSIAVTWGPDRDLLFIANASGDDLTAMSICTQVTDATSPTGFRSGSTGLPVANTCQPREDQELLPGPIRVFPGSITAGDRPSRLAGARLLKLNSDGTSSSFGAVLVAGLAVTAAGRDPLIRVIDANNILAASQRTPPTPVHPPFDVALPAPAVDVVASEVPGQRVRAFVVSQAPAGAAILTAFDVSAQDSGPVLVPAARCTLDLVATRLALVPGTDDLLPNGVPAHVYVADGSPDAVPGGKGDGAVEVSVAAMPPYDPATFTACPAVRRLPASDPTDVIRVARPLRSIALSPSFFQAKSRDSDPNPITPIPARGGAILLGVTLGSSALCGLPGVPTCGEGSIVIVQTNPAGTPRVAPAPPVDFFAVPAGAQAMPPLHALSGAREITFLRPIPGCPNGANACVDITTGLSTRLTAFQIQLGAVASTDDGGTVLINVIDRRFVDDLRDERINNAPDPNAALPPALSSATFFPSPPIGQEPPQLLVPNVIPPPAGDPFSTLTGLVHPCPDINTPACLNKGATTALRWAVIWHGVMPGLESVAGTLHRDTDTGPVRLELVARDLSPWITSPRLALQAGDVVHIRAIANPAALCSQLAGIPATQDLLIKAVEPHALVLEPAGRVLAPPFSTIPAFSFPASCGAVGVAVDVRTGSTTGGEWLVTAGTDVRGRVNQGSLFVSKAQRFDNPIDVPAPRPQLDIEVAFVPFGALPTLSGQQFVFTTARGTQPTTIRETNVVPQGPSGDVFAYQSGHFSGSGIIAPNLLFTSLTGNNALVRSSPANIGSQSALVVYR